MKEKETELPDRKLRYHLLLTVLLHREQWLLRKVGAGAIASVVKIWAPGWIDGRWEEEVASPGGFDRLTFAHPCANSAGGLADLSAPSMAPFPR